jgi:hypothetical protein
MDEEVLRRLDELYKDGPLNHFAVTFNELVRKYWPTISEQLWRLKGLEK